MLHKIIIPLTLLTLVSSCALFAGNSNHNKGKKSSLPKASRPQQPGGQGNNWRYLGISDNNQIITEIDNNSIKLINQNNLIYYYKDRKTTTNNQNNLRFEYIISEWNMSCLNKNYILLQDTLYNESGIAIKTDSYQNQNNWRTIENDSIADAQYQFICNNKNRNLGY